MDDKWIEHLMQSYSSALLKYLTGHTHTREDAEDILQEVFLSCHKHAAEFDPERCNEQAWLYIIAKRKLVSYYRARKDDVSLDAMETDIAAGKDDMENAVNVMTCRQALAKALTKLDERSRSVIVLRCLKGLSPEETAKYLGVSNGNVRVIQSRALDRLAAILEEQGFSAEDFF
ncbi:MAG: sigma-70 family RNA polymerase sigma factor [Eubacteriales bacterium]|nr:sigma-70 family RNA polymerase sigma factor [Eubacteriales bacterium]